jgi:hypothetical protein
VADGTGDNEFTHNGSSSSISFLMLEIAHVKGKHSTLIILHICADFKRLQGILHPDATKNAAASGRKPPQS